MIQKDIKDLTLIELKAFAFEEEQKAKIAQQNFQVLYQAINQRQQESPVAPEPKACDA